jgi:hypothetical protein
MKRARGGSRISMVVLAGALAAAVAGGGAACNTQGFDPQSKVDSVRLFAVRADKPYAKPGEDVTLEALMTDGRREKPSALKLYWIPFVCMNPRDDLYYLCFVPDQTGGNAGGGARLVPVGPLADAGAGAGVDAGVDAGVGADAGARGGNPLGSLPPGVDLSPFLPQGTTFRFTMPTDAIQPREGIDPYGLAIVFNVACAGRIELAALDPSAGLQQVPILCTDEQGNKLSPKDYVIGISRVYSYATRTNANPVIEALKQGDQVVDPAAGVVVDHCTADKSADCPDIELDVRVSDASWEDNPNEAGESLREQIWVDYYSDVVELGEDARLLFDANKGRIEGSAVKLKAPKEPADGTLWAVVHDNRGGAAWVVVPLHVK